MSLGQIFKVQLFSSRSKLIKFNTFLWFCFREPFRAKRYIELSYYPKGHNKKSKSTDSLLKSNYEKPASQRGMIGHDSKYKLGHIKSLCPEFNHAVQLRGICGPWKFGLEQTDLAAPFVKIRTCFNLRP